MTDPITRERFNPLAYVPALALALALAAGWADLKSDVNAAGMRDEAMERRVSTLETGASAQEARTRVLENSFGRMEERLVSIGEGIARIERRLGAEP